MKREPPSNKIMHPSSNMFRDKDSVTFGKGDLKKIDDQKRETQSMKLINERNVDDKKYSLSKINEKGKDKEIKKGMVLQLEVGNSGKDHVTVKNKGTINRLVKVPSNKHGLNNAEYMALTDIPGKPRITDLIHVNGTKSNFLEENQDVSWLLDYALIGMAKTGTTSLYKWLKPSLHGGERCDLVINDITVLVNSLYKNYQPNSHNNGLKCPQDIISSLNNYAKYFPSTKLIVGIRHPILWFESLYNFRSMQTLGDIIPTNKLTKRCIRGSRGVCAWRANIADFLSVMGKTPMKHREELDLLQLKLDPIPKSSSLGKVFLYEIQQLPSLSKDLLHFLNYPPVKLMNIPHFNNQQRNHQQQEQSGKYHPINICDNEHVEIRQALLNISPKSSLWIRNYFLQSPDVHVSNKTQLIQILENDWMKDPCLKF